MKRLANCGFTMSVKTMMVMTLTMMMTMMMMTLTMVMLLSSRYLGYQKIFAKLFSQLFNRHCFVVLAIQIPVHCYQVKLTAPTALCSGPTGIILHHL